ncbi:MAG: aminotransferase class III-fold pyridoxal phosphate-dependent enzyme [Capsulimonadales bacterium]|nr:aminotransferase class III-fold pyridoxal phosphate-dependent enzyme [Capsulimonadales bacterium]
MSDPIHFGFSAEEAARINEETARKYQQYVSPAVLGLLRLGGYDAVEWQGVGSTMYDVSGNAYIDCVGGFGVFALGHTHPEVLEATIEQMRRLPLSSKSFLNKPLADLAERLAQITPGDLQYSFFSNSGAEAVEAALKFARIATGRTRIVSTVGSYHGKTFGALSASGRETYRVPFAPLLPDIVHVPYGEIGALEEAVTEETAGVLLEPIQGENGIRIPPDDYLPAARRICDRRRALLILDEVQTGLGRTGRMFACEHADVAPDILTLAKALGGGVVPIGATVATAAIWEKVFAENPFLHSSTFGGNEMACTAALATLRILERDGLAAAAVRKGERLLEGLRQTVKEFPDLLVEARGRGLMIGVEFTDTDIGKLAIGALVKQGVIAVYTLNNPKVTRFEPPLIITDEEIDRVVVAFRAAIAETQALLRDLLG